MTTSTFCIDEREADFYIENKNNNKVKNKIR